MSKIQANGIWERLYSWEIKPAPLLAHEQISLEGMDQIFEGGGGWAKKPQKKQFEHDFRKRKKILHKKNTEKNIPASFKKKFLHSNEEWKKIPVQN